MAAIDRQAIDELKIPGLLLMEHAGLKVLEAIRKEIPTYARERFLIVAGTGNNAGDGFVLARLLARVGAIVGVELLVGDEKISGDARVNLDVLAAYGIEVFHARPGNPLRTLLGDSTVVVDAMLGTGARGTLKDEYLQAVEAIEVARQRGKRVVSVDVPTGLDAVSGQVMGAAVRAGFTVTMGLPKIGFFQPPAQEHLGKLYVAEIGFPPQLLTAPELTTELTFARDLRPLYPHRRTDSHKGTYGRVLVIGGSRGMVGAPVMAARAALRGGAGLVRLVVPASQQIAAAALAPEVMVTSVEGDRGAGTFGPEALGEVLELARWADVVLVGPGLSRGPGIASLVRGLVAELDRPTVLDADALHALEPGKRLPAGDFLATPHAGELSAVRGLEPGQIRARRADVALESARALGASLVLKGPSSLVASPAGRLAINPTGGPALATAGTGDVLAGLLAAMRAYPGTESFDALRLACYLHGLAGDLAAERLGEVSVTAPDLLEELPAAFRILEQATGAIAYDKVRVV